MSTSAAEAGRAEPAASPLAPPGGEQRLLTGWGRTAPSLAMVHRPTGAPDVAALLAAAGPRGTIARGLGRSYGDAAQNAGGRVLATEALSAIRSLDADTGLATVEAGVDLATLARAALPLGWFLPVVPGTAQVSVGGAIAADVHGKNHHRDGSFCAHVRSFELQTPSGERLTVTPEAEPGVFAATAGGMGLTGVVTEATIQLLRVESDRVRVDTERAADLDDVMARMESGDAGYRYSVAWLDCLASGGSLGRSVLMRGDHASAGEARSGAPAGDSYAPAWTLSAPPAAPPWLLSRPAVRAFNEAWFRRAPRLERGRLEPLHSFFHPLDGVRGWNRLYGPGGLLQFQFAVPFGAEVTLRTVLERLSGERTPAFLAVLKRFGPQGGLLSFPLEGWTLAVDMPAARPELGPLLDGLDELVADAGGRVYLAKDSRLRPELLDAMYPGLERWRAARGALDPDGAMRSDLSRRIGLA